MYKMVGISAEPFTKNCIHTITQLRKGKKLALWLKMKDVEKKLGVENIYDSVDKETKGKFGTNYPTKQQIKKYKRNGSEFIEDIKFIYAHECIIMPIIMHCRSPAAIEFRSKFGLNQNDITLAKEQSVLKSIKIHLKEKICKLNTVF